MLHPLALLPITYILSWAGSLPACSSPDQNAHGSGISNILGAPPKPRFNFHSFMKWPIMASQELHRHELSGLSSSLKLWKVNSWGPFLLHLSCLQSLSHINNTAKFGCQLGVDSHSCDYISSSFCMVRKLLSTSKHPLGFLPSQVVLTLKAPSLCRK